MALKSIEKYRFMVEYPEAQNELLDEIQTKITELANLANELRSWAIALATKLNADTGVADTDYDTTITAPAVSV